MTQHVLLCRQGFELALADEVPPAQAPRTDDGLVVTASLPATARIFERQRIPNAHWLPEADLKPLRPETANAMLADLTQRSTPWLLHAYGVTSDLDKRCAGFARAVLREFKQQNPEVFARKKEHVKSVDPDILQLCRTPDGLWYGVCPRSELSDPHLAGVHRMKFDEHAPSRSYLKLEEAFDRMGQEPTKGQSAIDLGAAPGGWSWSLLKRGCQVTAVDNGPMKVESPHLSHVRGDGLTWGPEKVDWLVGDMLIAPGICLSMLRRWVDAKAMQAFVINVKIPQQQPIPALKPLLDYLKKQSAYTWQARQLYHDRREITLMGQRAFATT